MAYPRIISVSTANPPHRFTQEETLRMAGYRDRLRTGFFLNSGIDGRFLAIDPERFRPDETVDDLNDRFAAASRDLATRVVSDCLERNGLRPGDIDFLATTTCTGRLCPSLDARLIRDLKMRPDIQRVHVGDTGCASAVVALQQAWNHLRAFPDHTALVVPVEICSATYYLDDDPETAVANAIFADGAAAVLLRCSGPGVKVISHSTRIEAEYLDRMGFTYPGGRPRILLSKEIRGLAGRMMRDLAGEILEKESLKKRDIRFWVLHSAGRRVLDRAARLLEFQGPELEFSRRVLQRFGNMSSATVLFVLKEILDSGKPVSGDRGILMSLGPGFAAEGLLLEW